MSDPLLLIASALIVIGPLVFLISLIQFIRSGKKNKKPMTLPHEELPVVSERAARVELPPMPSYIEEEKPEPAPVPIVPEPKPVEQRTLPASERTVVMPAGMGEVQGQLEIAFTQIKTLNKKIAQLESELETLSRNAATKLETNELKEVPMNPADFTQKLLKLAEHVIVLEKEVARMKTGSKSPGNGNGGTTSNVAAPVEVPAEPAAPKPPIMPI